MKLEKKVLMKVEQVYTANAFRIGNDTFVAAGSETTPQVFLYNLNTGSSELVADCPGGVMSFVPLPGNPDMFFSIMGLFPPFVGADAGLFMHCRTDNGWKTVKQMPLPFAHRCDILEAGGRNWVFAASVSRFKENPADWSCKGEVYVIGFDDNGAPKAPQLLYNSLTRNHGMLKCLIDGENVMCVSGAEGIFGFTLSVDGKWKKDKLFDREVSEFGFVDLDGDGQDELVTIEPFHGNTLNIYKKHGDAWNPLFTDSLSFGHGLSCGMFRGEPIVAVGNRRGTFTLDVFTAKDPANGLFERHQIEQDAGPTQTLVFNSNGVDYILSANQKQNEVVLYY